MPRHPPAGVAVAETPPAPLPREFFARPSPLVARELLGCWMVRRLGGREIRVQISETEAYLGGADPASHAFRGRTARNSAMFGVAGMAYVYFVYGMHHCFNVVTGQDGEPQAVLVRGAVNCIGTERADLPGPALLCRALRIDLACNGADLCQPGASSIWFEAGGSERLRVLVTPRVGVRDHSPLRFAVAPANALLREHPTSEERAPKGSLCCLAGALAPVPADKPGQISGGETPLAGAQTR